MVVLPLRIREAARATGIRKGSAIWGPDFIERMESKLKQIALFDSRLFAREVDLFLKGLSRR